MRFPLGRTLVIAASAALLGGLVASSPAQAAERYPYDFGSQSIAGLGAGGRYIYVSPTGSNGNWDQQACRLYSRERQNEGCTFNRRTDPFPNERRPMRTIQRAAEIAYPGDVIVVEKGEYDEVLGYNWRSASVDNRITIQNKPGELVTIKGQLTLKTLSNWTIDGFRIWPGPGTTNTALVTFLGGDRWNLRNSIVAGSKGYANIIIQRSGSVPASNFRLEGNCINQATGRSGLPAGTVHNVYVYPGLSSRGGVIRNNIMWGAKNGANIKAAGSKADGSSPGQLVIERNTLLYSSTGVVTGLDARNVLVRNNFIARKQKASNVRYEAAMKSYQTTSAATARTLQFRDNLITEFTPPLSREAKKPSTAVGNKVVGPVAATTGSTAGCTVHLSNAKLDSIYGHSFRQG